MTPVTEAKGLRTLRHHLLRVLLLASLLPLVAVTGLSLWQYQRDIDRVERFVGDESLAAVRVAAQFLDFMVDDTRMVLERLAGEMEHELVSERALHREVKQQPQIGSLVITDARGRVLRDTLGEQRRNLSTMPGFQAVREGAEIAYSDVYHSDALGRLAISVAVPYHRNERFRGAIIARLSVRDISSRILARLHDPRWTTYMTDRNGRVIMHSNPEFVDKGLDLKTNPPVREALKGKRGTMKYESQLYGSSRIGSYLSLPDVGWAVVSVRETGDSLVDVQERLQNNLLIALLTGLLVIVMALLWGRGLARPLESMASAMRQVRDVGLYALPVPHLMKLESRTDVEEYDTLASAYNALISELNKRFEEIMAYQEELQAQNEEIQAQSEEIQAQNEELFEQNESLARLSEEAKAASKLKSEFLATMSHELRTPLNSIIGYTELVLMTKADQLDDRSRGNLGVVLRNARNLLNLINDILDLSKVEAGKETIYPEPFDPSELLASVVATAEPLARDKGLRLTLDVAPGLGTVVTDQTKLRQVLLNLVSNGIKFTKQGGVSLSARTIENDRWVITVADTGIGISSEHQEAIFEAFRQVDSSHTRESGGSGLGLSIARKLIDLLGGRITLESTPGQGSVFTIELPIGQDGYAERAIAPLSAPAVSEGKIPVIVIDDDPEMLHLVSETLKDSPYEAIPASTGESGLKLARELNPYAVTLDILMPAMDGWTVLRQLKEDPLTAGVPVIILSFVENKLLAFSLGAAAYLVKPIDRTDLVATLKRLRTRLAEGYVLVVDDDADARMLYRQLLGDHARIVEAADGREATVILETEPPSLVILDLMMPQMDGFEVMSWLHERGLAHVPVVIVTAKDLSSEDEARLREASRIVRKGTLPNTELLAVLESCRSVEITHG